MFILFILRRKLKNKKPGVNAPGSIFILKKLDQWIINIQRSGAQIRATTSFEYIYYSTYYK